VQPADIRRKAERIYAEYLRAWAADGVKSRIVCKRSGLTHAAADASRTFFPIA
jgi:hypothetical protein